MLKGEMLEISSWEFNSGLSICRNKGPQSDLGAPFYQGPSRPGGTGGPFLRLCAWLLKVLTTSPFCALNCSRELTT